MEAEKRVLSRRPCARALCCQVRSFFILERDFLAYSEVRAGMPRSREHLKDFSPWSPAKLQGLVICAADDELGRPRCSAAVLSRFGISGERGIASRSSNGPRLVLAGCWLSPGRDE